MSDMRSSGWLENASLSTPTPLVQGGKVLSILSLNWARLSDAGSTDDEERW